MKLIFMGAPDFAVPTLQALIDSPDHDVVAVYSQPPRPAGRGQKLRNTAVHDLAEQSGITALTPTSLKTAEAQAEFANFGADAAIVAAYGLLLPKAILEACPRGCINVHPSALPRWRGAAPIQRPIIAGDTSTQICIMQMGEGLDTGDVLLRSDSYNISGITAETLHDKLSTDSAPMVLEVLKQAAENTLSPVPQTDEGKTYAKKLNKNTGAIDFSKTAHEIECLIRGVTPWPGAFFMLAGEKFKIIAADSIETEPQQETGITLDDQLTIACADGTITPTTIQRQGKKAMETDALLRGFEITKGTKLND
jgi:methionyl-tRNA formyltransferase